MSNVIFREKAVAETIQAVFDFSSLLALGESISSASVSAAVYSGTDSSPSSLISGSAAISSPKVTQKITGGVAGVVYTLTCTSITNLSNTITLSGYQAVI